MQAIGTVYTILWIFINMKKPYFGFVPNETAEMIGYNIGHTILLIVGLVFLALSFRRKKEEKEEAKEK